MIAPQKEVANIKEFYEEICGAILDELDRHREAPLDEVTREVVNGMLLGEDEDTKKIIKKMFKL